MSKIGVIHYNWPDFSFDEYLQSAADFGYGYVELMSSDLWPEHDLNGDPQQMQDAAEAAGGAREDIGYWPFPYQVDGAFHSAVGGDYKNAINVNSDNKATARAWIDWFANESGYAADQGGISPVVGGDLPATLADFEPLSVELIETVPAPSGKEALEAAIYNGAEIDIWGNLYRQKLVDIARGAADGDKESYFAELNEKWAAARAAAQ